MKKLFSLLSIILLSICGMAQSPLPLKVLDIPVKGDVAEFAKKLLAKDFQLVNDVNGVAYLYGAFNNHESLIMLDYNERGEMKHCTITMKYPLTENYHPDFSDVCSWVLKQYKKDSPKYSVEYDKSDSDYEERMNLYHDDEGRLVRVFSQIQSNYYFNGDSRAISIVISAK